MSLTTKLPRYYYSASNKDGSISTSRFGADSDKEALNRAKSILGGSLGDATLYRHEDTGGRINYIEVEVK